MKGYQKYQKASVEKMSPIKLTIMMYQKCLLNMKWIKENINNVEKSEAEKYYSNTELILYELQLSLDRSIHLPLEVKEHVADLDRRYAILLNQLIQIKDNYDGKVNDDLIIGFEKLLEGYRSATSNKNEPMIGEDGNE